MVLSVERDASAGLEVAFYRIANSRGGKRVLLDLGCMRELLSFRSQSHTSTRLRD